MTYQPPTRPKRLTRASEKADLSLSPQAITTSQNRAVIPYNAASATAKLYVEIAANK
jgi:hypothetical protein